MGPTRNLPPLAVLLAALLASATLLADPAAVLTSGGTVRLMDEHPSVALVSEKIVMDVGIGNTEVTVVLNFKNEGAECVAQMGFPTLNLRRDRSFHFVHDFAVDVDGEAIEVTQAAGKLKLRVPVAEADGKPKLIDTEGDCTWHLFKVPFKAGESRRMRVRYDERVPYANYDTEARVPYILSTGGTWRGPIGEVQIEVKLGDRLNYHKLTLKGDGKPLEFKEQDDTLTWSAKDYNGEPGLLEFEAGRGPAVLTTDGGGRLEGIQEVRWHHGRLYVQADFLADLLCVQNMQMAIFHKEGRRVELESRPFDAFASYSSLPQFKLYVDPKPALDAFDAAMDVTRDERGDACVAFKLYVRKGAQTARATAECLTQKPEFRLRCLGVLDERFPDACAPACETICCRPGEHPDVVQKALQLLSERKEESCRKICREILTRTADHPAVMLWALGYLADEKPDDAAVEGVLARVPGADAQERTKALADIVLSSRYDPPVRGGAMVLGTLDPAAARQHLVTGISRCPNWMDGIHRGRNAGLALRLMRMDGAREMLVEAIKGYKGQQPVEDALIAIGLLGDDAAIPYLVETAVALDTKVSRNISCAAAEALARMGTPKSLAACAQVMERSRDGEVIRRALKGFDIAAAYQAYPGKAVYYWSEPRPAPEWARSTSVEESCRVAALLLERVAAMEHLKDYSIDKRLTYLREKITASAGQTAEKPK